MYNYTISVKKLELKIRQFFLLNKNILLFKSYPINSHLSYTIMNLSIRIGDKELFSGKNSGRKYISINSLFIIH